MFNTLGEKWNGCFQGVWEWWMCRRIGWSCWSDEGDGREVSSQVIGLRQSSWSQGCAMSWKVELDGLQHCYNAVFVFLESMEGFAIGEL